MAFGFPNPVNELAARTVAALVLVSAVAILVSGAGWALWALAAGFALRVGWGPRFSPFGLLATRAIAPRLGPPRLVPGPPKRFAQAIGLAVTLTAALAWSLGAPVAAAALTGVLVLAASLEAVLGLCLGCRIFAALMRLGLVPTSVCEACDVVSRRLRERSAALRAAREAEAA